jgi:anthraniloyl-CoA monooxygenase
MQIGVLGGGPAGLYFSLLMKRAHPGHDVTVVERNPRGATYGWGVVFSDRTLGSFREADLETYEEITDRFVIWDAIDVLYQGEVLRCGGQVFSGISRRVLLGLLQQRCADLGVNLVFEEEFAGPDRFPGADLVVAADGVRSPTRSTHEGTFGPRMSIGRSKYAWFGTTLPLDCFTFIFRSTEHGLFQVHSYPFEGTTSTFIVETTEPTWRRAGLDEMTEEDNIAFCEDLFAEELRGNRLMSNNSAWLNFPTVKNKRWWTDNVVLVGDSAHTAHFSIGSGTKLAMEDAIALARAFDRERRVEDALAYYEAERRPIVARFQHAASQSQTYFENTDRYRHLGPRQFAFNLLSRSGRMGYGDIRLRDPRFVTGVEARIDGSRRPATMVATPPALTPLALRTLTLSNRIVVNAGVLDEVPGAAGTGAGLVLTRVVAIDADGRIGIGDPQISSPEHVTAWREAVERVSPDTAIGIRIGHAGPRGATDDRSRGSDRPLADAWELIAPSAIPYAPWAPVPRGMDRDDMERVAEGFAEAAVRARTAGFGLAMIDMANGGLLASFLSPHSNRRTDGYGGAPASRMRFPLEVFDAVRARWPDGLPLGVRVAATEWVAGGPSLGDAVGFVKGLVARGCDLVEVTAGGRHSSRPRFDPYYLPSYADVIRNEARAITLATGQITTVDDAHTLVGAGRADLCLLLGGAHG